MLEKEYVWEFPVRLTHWINALCIVVLSATGLYIGHPFLISPGTEAYVMGWVRFIHYVFAYLFVLSVLARIIWLFLGNRYASWRAFVPWASAQGRRNMLGTLAFYTFVRRIPPPAVGHNPMAAFAYSGVLVLFLAQIVTGFALYGQYEPGSFWDSLFGSWFLLVGNQTMRLVHHGVMWLLIGFAIQHVYSSWLMDYKERNGIISSMFSGFKFIETKDRG